MMLERIAKENYTVNKTKQLKISHNENKIKWKARRKKIKLRIGSSKADGGRVSHSTHNTEITTSQNSG